MEQHLASIYNTSVTYNRKWHCQRACRWQWRVIGNLLQHDYWSRTYYIHTLSPTPNLYTSLTGATIYQSIACLSLSHLTSTASEPPLFLNCWTWHPWATIIIHWTLYLSLSPTSTLPLSIINWTLFLSLYPPPLSTGATIVSNFYWMPLNMNISFNPWRACTAMYYSGYEVTTVLHRHGFSKGDMLLSPLNMASEQWNSS